MKNEEQKLYQIGEYVRICRKKGYEYPAVFSDRQFSGYFGRRSYQTVQKL